MLFVLQLPFSDARPFVPGKAGKLDLPDWPPRNAIPPQFVRYFGQATPRYRGADFAWVDETSYYRAGRALRLEGLGSIKITGQPAKVKPRCVFRRLLSDGEAVTRVELGVSLKTMQSPIRTADLLQRIQAFLRLPSRVPIPTASEDKRGELARQGPSLATLFTWATTNHREEISQRAQKFVDFGMPLLVIDLEGEHVDDWDQIFHRLDPDQLAGLHLGFAWLQVDGMAIPAWILQGGGAGSAQLRSLRLCLLRLHAEQEALDGVLRQFRRSRIHFQPGTEEGDLLEDYLNRATRLIQTDHWAGFSQSSILAAFNASVSSQETASRRSLIQRHEMVRQQVWKKAERFEQERTSRRVIKMVAINTGDTNVTNQQFTFSGGHVTGVNINSPGARVDHIRTSFLESQPQDDLRQAVDELHHQIKSLLEHDLPEEQQRKIVKDLQVFTEQAADPEPHKGILEVTGKGLIEAAQTVAEMVGPITTAVKGVLGLLGVVLA